MRTELRDSANVTRSEELGGEVRLPFRCTPGGPEACDSAPRVYMVAPQGSLQCTPSPGHPGESLHGQAGAAPPGQGEVSGAS